MSDRNIELTRRKVLGGLASIGAASAAAGAGTMAYFSDSETSSGNTVSAGTVDLDSASQESVVVNSAPGDSASGTVSATYNGSISPVEVDISAALSEPSESLSEPTDDDIDGGGGDSTANSAAELSASEFARYVKVTSATLKRTSGGSSEWSDDLLVDDSNSSSDQVVTDDGTGSDPGSANVDLVELVNHLNANSDDAFGDVQKGDTVALELGLEIDKEADNLAQADSVELSVTFNAQQGSKD